MKEIYKAPLRRLTVKNLEINEGAIKNFEYDTPIIQKDLLFYKNWTGAYISFEHRTRLPDFGEAIDYVKDVLERRHEEPYPTCPFVWDDDITFSHEISNDTFKAMKKFYKKLDRNNKKK